MTKNSRDLEPNYEQTALNRRRVLLGGASLLALAGIFSPNSALSLSLIHI